MNTGLFCRISQYALRNTIRKSIREIKPQLPMTKLANTRTLSCTSIIRAKEMFSITYELGNGEKHTVQAKDGDNLLDVVINNDVDIDGFGACEGTLACSTCHIIFTPEVILVCKKGVNQFLVKKDNYSALGF